MAQLSEESADYKMRQELATFEKKIAESMNMKETRWYFYDDENESHNGPHPSSDMRKMVQGWVSHGRGAGMQGR